MEPYDNSLVEPIELRMIRPSKFPTRSPDPKDSPELESLKASIRDHGLLQPIIVRPFERGFEIVAGHRRFAACRSLRRRFIHCKIVEFDDKEAYEVQLTENLQRRTIDPVEEAISYQRYVNDFGWGGVSELGRRIGKSEEYVSHRIQLLRLPEDVRNRVRDRVLGISQALELTDTALGDRASELAQEIIDNKMTVKQIRRIKGQIKQAEAYDYSGIAPPQWSEDTRPAAHDDARSNVSAVRTKEVAVVKRSVLALRITLSRIDEMIEDAGKDGPHSQVELIQFLMKMRMQVHAMIDDALRYKRERRATA